MSINRRTRSFNVMLNDAEYDQLVVLAGVLETSKGAAIRKAIKHSAMMTLAGHPTCADGRACFVPHMHITPATPAAAVQS